MDRAYLKSLAKEQIKGNIGILLLIVVVYYAILLGAGCVPVVGSVALMLLSPALGVGLYGIMLNLADGKKPELRDLFAYIEKFWPAFKVAFLSGLYVWLWSLLLLIPGIIKGYAYSQVYYILAENPDLGAREALRMSEEMMKGHKMELFVLELSFIGWHLLGLVTFGLAYIWVVPYYCATHTNFYNSIKSAPVVDSGYTSYGEQPWGNN